MRVVASAVVTLLCLVVPGLLALSVARSRAKSRLYLASLVALAVSYVAVMSFSMGPWGVVGVFWPAVLAAGLLVALAVRLRRGIPAPWLPGWTREAALTALCLALASLFTLVLPFVFRGRDYAGEPLELAFPLRGGTFLVVGAGANFSVNHHSFIRAQRYALDLEKLNSLGLRASGLWPSDPARYEAFGTEVVAPCAGEVLSSRNDLPDRPPLEPDPANRLGNHVVLLCGEHSVALGHLQPGSVRVSAGESVAQGQSLGRVGSSGMSFEPHLHIHAVRGRHPGDPELGVTGEPVPLTFGGRFLIRNDRVSN